MEKCNDELTDDDVILCIIVVGTALLFIMAQRFSSISIVVGKHNNIIICRYVIDILKCSLTVFLKNN